MTNYNILSKFYDSMMGDRRKNADQLCDFVQENNPKARSVLELACGTGAVLKYFAKDYKVSGLDLSKGMLAVAKKEVPQAKFYRQSMVNFIVPEKFDAILCVFDSINHLLKFSDWKKMFISAQRHLNDEGVFIFDINTKEKLNRIISEQAKVCKFDKSLIIMDITDAGKGISNWNVKFFKHIKGDRYKLQEENIKEISFPKDQILQALKPIFYSVKIIYDEKNKFGDGAVVLDSE